MANAQPNESDKKSAFIKIINSFSGKYNQYQLFSDFVALSARAISNGFFFQETLEQEYLAIAKNYDRRELDKFCQLLALTVDVLTGTYHDFLGTCYMALKLGNQRCGQFFTPYHICQLMSAVQIANLENLPEQGFITVLEPTVGGGGLLIAFAERFIQQGFRPETQLFCTGIDIDQMVAEMAYIQLSLLNIPAKISVGDSLGGRLERSYFTPAYYLYSWPVKLNNLAEPKSNTEKNIIAINKPIEPQKTMTVKIEQFALF